MSVLTNAASRRRYVTLFVSVLKLPPKIVLCTPAFFNNTPLFSKLPWIAIGMRERKSLSTCQRIRSRCLTSIVLGCMEETHSPSVTRFLVIARKFGRNSPPTITYCGMPGSLGTRSWIMTSAIWSLITSSAMPSLAPSGSTRHPPHIQFMSCWHSYSSATD